MLEVLQRAWFSVGFIVFVIAWLAQSGELNRLIRAYRAALLAAAAIAVLFALSTK